MTGIVRRKWSSSVTRLFPFDDSTADFAFRVVRAVVQQGRNAVAGR